MDIQVQHEILDTIKQLKGAVLQLKGRADKKVRSQAEYEKQMALTLIKLKNGVAYELEGEYIQNPPASTTEKIARGLCWKERLAADTDETLYKNLITAIDTLKAILNGYQSINRHITEL